MKDFYRALRDLGRIWLKGWTVALRLVVFLLIAGALLWAPAFLISRIPADHVGLGEMWFFSILFFGVLLPLACWAASRVTGEFGDALEWPSAFAKMIGRTAGGKPGRSELEERIRARRQAGKEKPGNS